MGNGDFRPPGAQKPLTRFRRKGDRSVCPAHCGKTEDLIRMPFGIIGRTGQGMRQVCAVWGSVHGKGYFWGRILCASVTNGDFTAWCAASRRRTSTVHIYECTSRRSAAPPTARTARLDAALFPNYFGQTCF